MDFKQQKLKPLKLECVLKRCTYKNADCQTGVGMTDCGSNQDKFTESINNKSEYMVLEKSD